MPTIPRYQPRGGPSVGGLNYAGAYSPPDGSDWRILAKAAEAAGSAMSMFGGGGGSMGQASAGEASAAATQTATAGRTAANAEDHILGQAQEVAWRRAQLQAEADAIDADLVRQSRQEAADALPQGARRVFDALTGPREAGFMAAASARAAERVWEASRTLSLERQALGVDEYHALIETAPEQAMAALGSAAGELAARMRESGADAAEIQSAQKDLVSGAQADRVSRALETDPDRAAALLNEGTAISETVRGRLAEEIEAEQLRRGVQREVGRWIADNPSLADDPDRLAQLIEAAGGGDEDLTALYQGAALSETRAHQARIAEDEERAWAPVEALLAAGKVRSWTDLPTRQWRDLPPNRQADLRILTGQGPDGGPARLFQAQNPPVNVSGWSDPPPSRGRVLPSPPPPPPPPLPSDSKVDWQYIMQKENGEDGNGVARPPKLNGYQPGGRKSGVTIATGVDIGQKSEAEIRRWKLSPALFAKLKPYIGLKGPAARAKLKAAPLTITAQEAGELDLASNKFELGRLIRAWDQHSTIGRFTDLPAGTQTALYSFYIHHGAGAPATTKATKQLWLYMMDGDWAAAENEIRVGFPADRPKSRRPDDADKIRADIQAGRLKLKPGTALKPLPPPPPPKPKKPAGAAPKPPLKPASRPPAKPAAAPKGAPKPTAGKASKKTP